MYQLKAISWPDIQQIWRNHLWPGRVSDITANSAMVFLGGYNSKNMEYPASFWAYVLDDKIVAVNAGHMCADNSYRSRGLWVDTEHRGQGLGQGLLTATISQARQQQASFCWSLPRKTSWSTYQAAGFQLASEWFSTETSNQNAYCRIDW